MTPQATGETPATPRHTENAQETLNESWLADERPPASLFNESQHIDTSDEEVSADASSSHKTTAAFYIPNSAPGSPDAQEKKDSMTLPEHSRATEGTADAKQNRKAKLAAIATMQKQSGPAAKQH